MIVRPATLEDVRRFYPDIRASFRAWVAELDGVVEGIIGLVLLRPYACMFSVFNEPLRPYLKTMPILRLIKRVQGVMIARGLPVVAVAEKTEPTAPAILARLGFEYDGDIEMYIWRGA